MNNSWTYILRRLTKVNIVKSLDSFDKNFLVYLIEFPDFIKNFQNSKSTSGHLVLSLNV